MVLKACFQSDRNDDGQSGSAATGPDDIHTKISQRFPKQLSWVQCERTDRIRRSPPGDWNILRPATRKSSTYESFASAFFLPVNTAWTPNLFISFSFHYFHKWHVERSEWAFQVPLKFPDHFHVWNQIADFPLFEGKKDKISTSSHSTDTPTLNKKLQKRLYTYNLFRNFLIYL